MRSKIPVTCALISISCFASLAKPAETSGHSVFRAWSDAAVSGARDSRLPAPEVARALAIVHTCMYDAWSAYDDRAVGTQLKDLLRRPPAERTQKNKEEAISFAAYRALTDLFPVDSQAIYVPLLKQLGLNPDNRSDDLTSPAGIANVACGAVLEFRHHDKSNQLGDLAPGPYADWTGYVPRNKPTTIAVNVTPADPDHWQPLIFVNGAGDRVTQKFAAAQWARVTPFALQSPDQFRALAASVGPAHFGSSEYQRQVDEILTISANLTDRQKIISEYWTDGFYTAQPPGHWVRIAQWVSGRDHHSLDDDVKFFFVLSNALFDAGIAAWDAKVKFDSVRPITAVRKLYAGKMVKAWGGPGKGAVQMDGASWCPYQEIDSPTPPFAEFVSAHSAYSAAAAAVLQAWSASDTYGESITIPAGSSKVEPGVTPRQSITLSWSTFSEAADQAGLSRRYGGIHFKAGDEGGRLIGKAVAKEVWIVAQSYFEGHPPAPRLLALTTQ